jgi:N-acetylmuramoyl-L-alanine amidase CwlA
MAQHDVPASRVVRHYDASRKLCPLPYCGTAVKNTRWTNLRKTITGKVETAKPNVVKNDAKVVDAAKNYTKSFAGTYRCTDELNLRKGAGTKKQLKVTMPKNTKVQCYGYWSPNGTTKWLLVSVKLNGVEYVGYCSKKFLKKVV